ncbi:MAG: hypothetical protein GXO26_08620 [Crenarchaeota archaeon]|nr:hypothetical protein [Thermoproteota archaeon]
MSSISLSDIIMCIILLAVCASLIPIIKFEFIKLKNLKNIKKCNDTIIKNHRNETITNTTRLGYLRDYKYRGFMLTYFVLIILIVMIVLIIVMSSLLR